MVNFWLKKLIQLSNGMCTLAHYSFNRSFLKHTDNITGNMQKKEMPISLIQF